MKELRLLKPNEIDVRVGTINEKGATLLLYKDARVDMNILDESKVKWKRSHELINGNLFCTISVWDEDIKEWISRQDVGVESNTEKEKGQASDAFKRAGFNFGIGRELYTAPFTWISADSYSGFINGKTPQGKDRYATYDKFEVSGISYDDNKEIKDLEIKNTKTGRVVFTMGKSVQKQAQPKKREDGHDLEILARAKADINDELVKQGYNKTDTRVSFINGVLGKNSIDSIDDAILVANALDDNQEPGINADGTYNK